MQTKILGLSFHYHDSAATLLVDGVPVAMAQEERFSRKKNDASFPKHAIDFVFEEAKIQPSDLDYVVFYEKPFLKFERILKTFLRTFPVAPLTFQHGMKSLFSEKLWIRSIIAEELKIPADKIFFSEHHLSHAASAFFASPFEEAAILTVDGVGEWATTTISHGKGNSIKMLKEIHFPDSLGLLYSAFTAFLGFEVNEGEYKVMGMAPYGKPLYVEKVKQTIEQFSDGSFRLRPEYFLFDRSRSKSFSKKFEKLFGKPRKPHSKFFTRDSGWPSYFGEKPANFEEAAQEQEYYADVAASVQAVLEEAMRNLAAEAHRITGAKNLCLAGGVALNSVANWKIFQQGLFKDIFVQPAAGDSGGALGAALYLYHQGLEKPRKFVQKHSYYGKKYSQDEILTFLKRQNISHEFFNDEQKLLEATVERLLRREVAGWFHGKFEWGPRALGARSILANPTLADMKDLVNTKIKFREPYRPFAPSVLSEHAHEFFDIGSAKNQSPFRFMLYVADVLPEKKASIPAVTHVDGTARPQFVFKEESPRYWNLINLFYQKTGIPLLLNTSFNLKGEPIVNSPHDAFKTFQTSGIDFLVLENFIVKKNQ